MTPAAGRANRAGQPTAVGVHADATSRAGRNLPAAIAVGLALGIVVVASLVLWPPAFVALVTLTVAVGAWELIGGMRAGRINAPRVPTMLGAVALVPVSYVAGSDGLVLGFALTALAILLWRAMGGLDGAARDVAGGVFVTAYLPLMAGFTSLMLVQPDGPDRVLVFVVTTTMSDIGGYAVGAVTGRHPMAPSISPKKSWEGFVGSVVWCVLSGMLTVTLLLGRSWWAGVLVGLAVALFATIGDLAESTVKRDLGIKDMGSVLPGHGGVMDRLDSLLVTAPVVWALLTVLVPA